MMPDAPTRMGLRVAGVFYGFSPPVMARLAALVQELGDVSDPRSGWFVSDNLLTYGRSRGFLTDQRFVAAVVAAKPTSAERSLAWRTHTVCWAARSCEQLDGDFVECGSYRGYTMDVVLHYLNGLVGRRLWLYDLFDPSGAEGEGARMPEHSPQLHANVLARFAQWPNVTVTRGKVPDILATAAPERIAFLHIDMNNVDAERGAIEYLFDRIVPGGIVIFDDYGWTSHRDQMAAADIFAASRGLSVLELPTGQGMVLKR
jgi:O-methyltransferase